MENIEVILERLGRIEQELQTQVGEQREIKHRVGTIERVMIATNLERVLEDVNATIGGNPIRAAILALCKQPCPNEFLISRLGLQPSTLTYHTSKLERGDLLTSRSEGNRKIWQRTPLCEKINIDQLYRDLIQEGLSG